MQHPRKQSHNCLGPVVFLHRLPAFLNKSIAKKYIALYMMNYSFSFVVPEILSVLTIQGLDTEHIVFGQRVLRTAVGSVVWVHDRRWVSGVRQTQ